MLKLAGVALTALAILVILRNWQPPLAAMMSLVTSVVLFLVILPQVQPVITVIERLALKAHLDQQYLALLFKVLGIAYLAEFAAQICVDAGEKALAAKVQLGGKVLILVLAIPVVVGVLNLVLDMLP